MVRCAGDSEPTDPVVDIVEDRTVPAQITTPNNDAQYTIGDSIKVEIKINKPNAVSNLELFVADTLFAGNLKIENQTITIPTGDKTKVGWSKIFLSYKDDKDKMRSDTRKIVLFSNLFPGNKEAVIVNTYPHDKTSYTQGLEFHNGKLFEGTGQYNQSVLAEVDLNSGAKLREHTLQGSVFGEGITILNDTIFQITYKSQICYLYDLDFNPIGNFKYDGEGWGLCNDGTAIIMSNGSSHIVWRNPKTFDVIKTIEVYDDAIEIGQLNELELINGNLIANIYTDNKIAEIDTLTGKVLNYITCRALVMDATEPGNDVLNGIAYNSETGKIYMTGKWWPKLYEVIFE